MVSGLEPTNLYFPVFMYLGIQYIIRVPKLKNMNMLEYTDPVTPTWSGKACLVSKR